MFLRQFPPPLASSLLLVLVAAATCGRAVADPGNPSAARTVDFNRDVRPILAKNCFSCHGADEKHREGGLRLDVRDVALKPLADGKTALVPAPPEQSELLRRATGKD